MKVIVCAPPELAKEGVGFDKLSQRVFVYFQGSPTVPSGTRPKNENDARRRGDVGWVEPGQVSRGYRMLGFTHVVCPIATAKPNVLRQQSRRLASFYPTY